jgi:hypothetical protein
MVTLAAGRSAASDLVLLTVSESLLHLDVNIPLILHFCDQGCLPDI